MSSFPVLPLTSSLIQAQSTRAGLCAFLEVGTPRWGLLAGLSTDGQLGLLTQGIGDKQMLETLNTASLCLACPQPPDHYHLRLLPSLHWGGVVWAGGTGGGCAPELLLTSQDAIVCLSGFAASLGPQQSVLLSSHIYIDPPPSTTAFSHFPPFSFASRGKEGSGSGGSEQPRGRLFGRVGRT